MTTETRRPFHVIGLVGLSATLYALDLAAVTAFQAQNEAVLAARQAPAQEALDAMRVQDAAVAHDITVAANRLQTAAGRYAHAGQSLSLLEQDLASLGAAASGLRSLPSVPKVGAVTAAPPVNATTGASGAPKP